MNNWRKFKRNLYTHQGVQVCILMHGLGFVAGLTNKTDASLLNALIASAIFGGIFWIPVIWTAWTGRNR